LEGEEVEPFILQFKELREIIVDFRSLRSLGKCRGHSSRVGNRSCGDCRGHTVILVRGEAQAKHDFVGKILGDIASHVIDGAQYHTEEHSSPSIIGWDILSYICSFPDIHFIQDVHTAGESHTQQEEGMPQGYH